MASPKHRVYRNAQQSIALCQPPTLQIRLPLHSSLLVSALPPTKSCRTSTWRVTPRRSAWLYKLLLECANLLVVKLTRVLSFGTRARAFRSRPTSPTSRVLVLRCREPSHNSRASPKVYRSKPKAKSLGRFTIRVETCDASTFLRFTFPTSKFACF